MAQLTVQMQFTSFPLVFKGARGWTSGESALAFIPMSIGCNLALLYMVFWGNPKYAKGLQELGYQPPEARLPSGFTGSVMLPVGLFIFAWTCVPVHIHWIVCMIGLLCFGSGMVLIFLATQNYLVDAYLPTAASVMAAGTVTRSIIGVVLPLFTLNMYDALGINWASCVVAFIALVFTPVPVLLFVYGRRIRRLTKHGRMSDDHYLALAEARTVLVREKTREGDAEMASRIPPINDIDEENDDPVLEDNLSERFANGVL